MAQPVLAQHFEIGLFDALRIAGAFEAEEDHVAHLWGCISGTLLTNVSSKWGSTPNIRQHAKCAASQ